MPNLQKKQYIIITLILISLIGLSFLLSPSTDGATDKDGNRITTVTRGDIEEVVTAQGKLEPKAYVDVGTQVSGQLKHIHVEIGDVVEKGMLLAEIDPRLYVSRVEADKAKLKVLEAQLAEQGSQKILAEQIDNRNKRLIKSKAISQEALEGSAAQLLAAEAKINATKAEIEEMHSTLEGDTTNLGYTKIFAPMDGTVTQLLAREGQTLNANQTAPVILQLANLDTMTVRAQVAEADVMRLKPQLPAYFSTLGALDRRWPGTVRQILPSPEIINGVVLYHVLIDVDNQKRELMTGMSTQVFFVLGTATNVPLLPVDALSQRVPEEDKEGQAYRVKAITFGGREERVLQIGLMNRLMAEIRTGAKEGDRIAISRPDNTQDKTDTARRQGGGNFMGGPRL